MTLAIIALVIAQMLYLLSFIGEMSMAQPRQGYVALMLALLIANGFVLGSLVDKVLP